MRGGRSCLGALSVSPACLQRGNVRLLMFFLSRLLPRDRLLSIDLPEIVSESDARGALQSILRAVSTGAISPAEGAALAALIAPLVHEVARKVSHANSRQVLPIIFSPQTRSNCKAPALFRCYSMRSKKTMSRTTKLARYRAAPLSFVEEVLIDPTTGKSFVLLDAERQFLRHAFTVGPDGRLADPELIFSCPKGPVRRHSLQFSSSRFWCCLETPIPRQIVPLMTTTNPSVAFVRCQANTVDVRRCGVYVYIYICIYILLL